MATRNVSAAAMKAAGDGDLENLLVAMTPGGIEAQEKRGQTEFVSSDTLPIEGTSKPEDRANFEGLGFKFGEHVDDLFVRVQFPAGWKKVATDHSMWSKIVDEKGRERASVFYKAAFYDRSAHVSLNHRFCVTRDYERAREDGRYPTIVKDGGKAIRVVGTGKDYDDDHRLAAEGEAWLNERYPNWKSPTAHWE